MAKIIYLNLIFILLLIKVSRLGNAHASFLA